MPKIEQLTYQCSGGLGFIEYSNYILTVDKDGLAFLDGTCASLEGRYQGRLPSSTLQRLLPILEAHGFFDELKRSYTEHHTTCGGSVKIHAKVSDGRDKCIHHYTGDTNAPVGLHAIEMVLNDLWVVVGDGWTRVGGVNGI